MQKQRVADQVAERIERLIVDGVLKVGQALPSERRLVAKLGCSRSALREGLRALRGRGIIDTEHGRGSFVADLDRNADASPLMHLFGSQPRTLYDLLEVRALLEGEAARLAALRGTEADFVLLARRYEEMLASHEEAQPIDPREHARRDHAFHRAISEASHNPVLVHTLQSLNELLLSTVFASVNNLYHRPPQKRQIDRQHARLYAALRERQPDQAQRAAREHIHSIRDNLREIEQEEQRLVRATLRLNGWGDAPPRRRPAAGRTCYPRRLLPPSRSPVMPSNALWLRADQLSSVSPPSSTGCSTRVADPAPDRPGRRRVPRRTPAGRLADPARRRMPGARRPYRQ